ncbi:excalibur calcium-binding domain-containing protein [Actinomyces ruminicola]|uniref:excalibur calcium-binding domain-containing protein n=1 Tax=Actinomyces ruminicola TaxID=332524 RepID=UPI0011C744B5|nr:excalibur calcium-binding domain-containing protein [Actinomyces ruminicola]
MPAASAHTPSTRIPHLLSQRRGTVVLFAVIALLLVACQALAGCGVSPESEAQPVQTTAAALVVPDLVGLDGKEAAEAIEQAGFTARPDFTDIDGEETVIIPENWSVREQDPAAGSTAAANQVITLTVNHDAADAAASAAASASAAAARAEASAAASASAAAARAAQEEAARQAEQAAQEEAARQAEQAAQEQAARQAEQAAPAPVPLMPQQDTSVYYQNCSEARAAGAAPLYRDDPGYRSGLDRDNDGIACE